LSKVKVLPPEFAVIEPLVIVLLNVAAPVDAMVKAVVILPAFLVLNIKLPFVELSYSP
jgi:hypothetical protein